MLTSLLAAVAATAATVSATTAAAVSASTGSTTTAASAVRGFVDTNPTSVEPEEVSVLYQISRNNVTTSSGPQYGEGETYSSLFKAPMAASASASFAKRTKPKPLLRPVSRSLTTTCGSVSSLATRAVTGVTGCGTDGFFDLAELFKLLAQSTIVGVPGKASARSQWRQRSERRLDLPNE
jgi:hypothetical protein